MPFWETWPQYNDSKENEKIVDVFGNLEKSALKHGVTKIVEDATVANSNIWILDWKTKEDLVNYILDWNMATWKNDYLESIITKACKHPTAADLRYLYEHGECSLKDNLVNLGKEKEKEKKRRKELEERYLAAKRREATTAVPTGAIPAAKIEPPKKDNILDQVSSEISRVVAKVSDTWKKFTDKLAETGKAVVTKAKETVSEILKLFDPSKIVSSKYEVRKGTTLCSRTAYKNGRTFWVNLPQGNAYNASAAKPLDTQHYIGTVPEGKASSRPGNWWARLSTETITSNDNVNFADIAVSSKSKYWHRAVAFKWTDNDWYVLDPYRTWRSTKPVSMEDYASKNKILKAHLYNAPWTQRT